MCRSKSARFFSPGTTNLHGSLVREPSDKRSNLLSLRREQRFLHCFSTLTKPFEDNLQGERSHLIPVVEDFLESPDSTLVTSLVAGTVALPETTRATRPPGNRVSVLACECRNGVVSCRMDVKMEHPGVRGALVL